MSSVYLMLLYEEKDFITSFSLPFSVLSLLDWPLTWKTIILQCYYTVGVHVFTRLCTAVSCRAMRTGRRRHGAPQSALCHPRSTKFPSVQHDKLRPTSILVRRPSCLELTARTFATNHFNRTFQALSKNLFIRADIVLSALETFHSKWAV